MIFSGFKESLKKQDESINRYSQRIRDLLGSIVDKYLGEWERFFISSKLNEGFSSLRDMFQSINIIDLRSNTTTNEYDLLFNIEFYNNLIIENIQEINFRFRGEYLKPFRIASDNACSYCGYEMIFENNTSIKVVKNNNLVTNDEEIKEVVHRYYHYANVSNLKSKRECLVDLSNKIEPFRGSDNVIYQIEEFVFKIFNLYNVRHNNGKGTSRYNNLLDTFTDEDYMKIYDITFNSAISIFAYYK